MSHTVELIPADVGDKAIVYGLFQFYLYEMSDFLLLPTSNTGSFDFPENVLDAYWNTHDHYPFLIMCNAEVAGFSLLRKYPSDKSIFDIGQFFILRKFMGQGIGRKAFELSVSKFPGQWMTRVLIENTKALGFWKSVIAQATNNNYDVNSELYSDKEMYFFRYSIPYP